MDHAMFLGVMSNALFGMIVVLSGGHSIFWPWADHVLFWGMNGGLVGFVISLLTNSPEFETVFTPILGGAILLAVVSYIVRLEAAKAYSPILRPAIGK